MMTEPAGERRRHSILLYGQHLSGAGHYVRTHEIARVLAQAHDVHLVEGGMPVPRADRSGIRTIELPRILRREGGLRPADPGRKIDDVLRQRQQMLRQAIARIRPDVLVIEYFPFSRWDLAGEITGIIEAARSLDRPVNVICSVRDMPRQTRREICPQEEYAAGVLQRLHRHFDAVMIHGDPDLTRLEEYFPQVGQISLPIEYTGIVSEKLVFSPAKAAMIAAQTGGAPFVLVSVGGGPDGVGLISCSIEAWDRLGRAGGIGARKLVICAGLGWQADQRRRLQERCRGMPIVLLPFTADFLQWLQAGELSISCAGYNTCANILETRARAVLVPNPIMSDQVLRAALMASRGFADTISPDRLDADVLVEAIVRGIAGPRPSHAVALNGAQQARAFVEGLVGRRFAPPARICS